ncbi:substrate-binding domain-containing protein [Bengtsoniella intestinalis]|uniref:substrate-binding domain-containing protein n=1 Tax=Bengtsoniella intestinalis TaxID=3073143 RepID=UPI00391F2EE2
MGIIGGLPRLSSTKERINAYEQAVADCGLPADSALVCYGDSMENSARTCLDQLLAEQCDAILVSQGLMGAEVVMYLQEKGLVAGKDVQLVTFVDYVSEISNLYADKLDCIIQPVEELGRVAGQQILKRIETPDAPVFEQILTSVYQPAPVIK